MKEEEIKREEEKSKIFLEKAIKEFELRFGECYNTKITYDDKYGLWPIFIVDDDLRILAHQGNGIIFSLVQKCERCGEEYTTDVYQLYQIGDAISKEHLSYDCVSEKKKRSIRRQKKNY